MNAPRTWNLRHVTADQAGASATKPSALPTSALIGAFHASTGAQFLQLSFLRTYIAFLSVIVFLPSSIYLSRPSFVVSGSIQPEI